MIYENIPFNEKGEMMEKFGLGISTAFQSQEFRKLIKEEALKKFNKDTDVLYSLIKNKRIDHSFYNKINEKVTTKAEFSNLHNFLIPFFSSEQELINFENQLPLLTIFVPELPENTFSAELWDVYDENQIPDVALRLDNITYVPVIGSDGENYLIAPEDVPGYPIVVLKENERVISSNHPLFGKLNTRMVGEYSSKLSKMSRLSEDEFQYLDNNYDPEYDGVFGDNGGGSGPVEVASFEGASDNYIPQVLKNAYNLFENDPYSWHRDYIYYGLTPTKSKGSINGGKYREHMATFRMIGSPTIAFNSLSDSFNEVHKDPELKDSWQRTGTQTAWTDGGFEITIDLSYGAKASNLGASISSAFGVSADDLFEVTYDKKTTGTWFWKKTYYRPRITGTKTFNTADPSTNGVRVEFSTWDLNNFANHWRFDFKEYDASTTTTSSEERTSKFNMNFSLDPTKGLMEKIGLKFGASYEETKKNTFTVVIKTGVDDLRGKDINFYDNPINKENGEYVLRKYSTGKVEFSLVPLQVQF